MEVNRKVCFKENFLQCERFILFCFICWRWAGDALDYLLSNTFTENAGARNGFPRVAVVITGGQSQDSVEDYAKNLRNNGVEIFTLGKWESDAVSQT